MEDQEWLDGANATLDFMNNFGGDSMYTMYWTFRGMMKSRGYIAEYNKELRRSVFVKI
jgi:hypothetical protein